MPVRIEDTTRCRRFDVRTISGVRVGPSPAWLQARLSAAGQRPINNVVDVTNYVMLELGQPNHPYDLARVRGGGLRVRRARPGETVVTLDDGVPMDFDLEACAAPKPSRTAASGRRSSKAASTSIGTGTAWCSYGRC